jgi:hypothetical protein
MVFQEMRRLEIMMAERCARNWMAPPTCSKPVGYVPGGRKVRRRNLLPLSDSGSDLTEGRGVTLAGSALSSQVQQVKLCNKRVAYGSDTGYIGVANTVGIRHSRDVVPMLLSFFMTEWLSYQKCISGLVLV